jgi:hypothetical protein
VKRGLPLLLLVVGAAAQANHPLLTDDTEVIDKGTWQLELHGERSRDRDGNFTARGTEASVALSYGVAKNLEIQVEQPYLRFKAGDGTSSAEVEGRGDVVLELKWNFYEHDGVALLLKPLMSLPTGSDELGAERAQYGLELVAAKEFDVLEVLGQLGYASNRNDENERASLWRFSAALLWSATERLKLFVDVSRAAHPARGEAAVREWAYGFQYDISSAVDFGLGVKNGLSDSADDRALLAGLRLRW